MTDSEAARRQGTSFGTITDCQETARGGKSCDYLFQVGGEQYTGHDGVDPSLQFGNIVTIYYDSQDPTLNSLENLSRRSGDEWMFACGVLLIMAILIVRDLSSKPPDREGSKQPII